MAAGGMLVKVRGDGRAFAMATQQAFGAGGVEVKPILTIPAGVTGMGLAPSSGATWLHVSALSQGEENPWDAAHQLMVPGSSFAAATGAAGADVELIEPDIEQRWPWQQEAGAVPGPGLTEAADRCTFIDQDGKGTKAEGPGFAWSLNDAFSELAKARAGLGVDLEKKLNQVIIAHLDTGYDPHHVTRPINLDTKLQRSFVDGDPDPHDASDHTPDGLGAVRNRGHGTATLALLAGNRLDGTLPDWSGFKDFIGGAPFARVIPIRIANWVVRFTTSTMVQGIEHARQNGAQILSMSMGGLTSAALVDAINLAYDAGMFLVTAAGNNLAGRLTPKSIVFPARYRRVLAACGVMADGRAYAGLAPPTMQGNYGPSSKMATALGAYTPNVAWAIIDCGKMVDMNGAGTSSATPQIAAAAALWLAEHGPLVAQYPEPWMLWGEALRPAECLFHWLRGGSDRTCDGRQSSGRRGTPPRCI
ncbi:S8/S53 family peptidase [Beijerinckia indica]|uniref:Peptidase S8 and S53 subtilisin kexin sedolisin n=1 Tax=Beijerinckia indica subsp. indica (strain ATCC 9039 / DSM 1715 / NCIMB 8712) TaxID=395963 RepID=B2IKE5_BEII9|nr:S8/S53 family peptidase [Beijerinckia indica]ACB96425.1 peptidase S8 and S53 subtilisin kexin sedolisin [Beijerinckia indica subsp. indica ATCC 9039]